MSEPKVPRGADDPAQSQRFIAMAKGVEADETAEALENAFREVTKGMSKTVPARHIGRNRKKSPSS